MDERSGSGAGVVGQAEGPRTGLTAEDQGRVLGGLIAGMQDAVLLLDREFRITAYVGNARAIYGWEEAEALGRSVMHDFIYTFPDGDQESFIGLMSQGAVARTRMRALRKQGDWIDLDVFFSPLVDDASQPTGFVAVSRDITARVEAERRLRESDEANRALVKELREALQRVKTLSGLLPICAWCKRIRSDSGYWEAIELFLGEHTEAKLSHGMCPDCFKEHWPPEGA
jgi:PAS domain S-box-containing protein